MNLNISGPRECWQLGVRESPLFGSLCFQGRTLLDMSTWEPLQGRRRKDSLETGTGVAGLGGGDGECWRELLGNLGRG